MSMAQILSKYWPCYSNDKIPKSQPELKDLDLTDFNFENVVIALLRDFVHPNSSTKYMRQILTIKQIRILVIYTLKYIHFCKNDKFPWPSFSRVFGDF